MGQKSSFWLEKPQFALSGQNLASHNSAAE